DYLAGFEEIETAGMWVHRMEDWGKSGHVATVRFELIGRPVGAPRSGIDRAIFRMRFVPQGDGLVIAGTELVEGDRVIADEPHFVDVGPEAGIDFENQYYPDFLTTELEFGMLRYGPAGISAVDIDEDGWYDLFIPDGVESKMFRNQGDGTFADITEAVGLSGQDGVSVAVFADYDNDGDKDAFISRTFTPNRLFRNDGGTYVDVTEEAGIGADCCTTVASWGDIDNDGLLDLYVGRYLDPRLAIPTTFYARNGEPNQLYRNNGDGTFTNVTESSGVGEVGLCLGSVFGDYDDDGDADLYVVNDFGRKTLYRNRGDGTYDDVTVETNTLAYGAGMSASFGDYDNDGLLDIYVAHIRSEEGWYAEAPTVMRYMVNSYRQGVWMEDMPLYWEIFRQSGFSFVDVFQDMASGNTLLRNKGDGTFDDVTWETEANPPGWFWGSGFADFDNDGWQDIYAANGWVYNAPDTEIELEFLNNVVSKQDEYKTGAFFDPDNFGGESWHGYERNRHLINLGDGNFKEVGRAVGTDLLLNSRGIAVADFWNRGVLDIAVAASTDRHALLRNEVGSARDYLAVELVGAAGELDNGSNRDAVGARVIVEAGGQTMTREIALGDGYSSQNSLRLYFGLGSERSADPEAPAPVVDKVTVRWPRSGIVQTFESVAGNRIVEIQENRDDMVEKTYAPPTIEAADDAVAGGEGTEVADVGTGGSGSGATAPSVAGEAP
ncbi:MAG: CRTAC1 family protein, partial [Acidobacteriota bacterium]